MYAACKGGSDIGKRHALLMISGELLGQLPGGRCRRREEILERADLAISLSYPTDGSPYLSITPYMEFFTSKWDYTLDGFNDIAIAFVRLPLRQNSINVLIHAVLTSDRTCHFFPQQDLSKGL